MPAAVRMPCDRFFVTVDLVIPVIWFSGQMVALIRVLNRTNVSEWNSVVRRHSLSISEREVRDRLGFHYFCSGALLHVAGIRCYLLYHGAFLLNGILLTGPLFLSIVTEVTKELLAICC